MGLQCNNKIVVYEAHKNMDQYNFQDGDILFGFRLSPEDFLRLFGDLLNLYHAANKDEDKLGIVVVGRKGDCNASIGENTCEAYNGVGILDLIINHKNGMMTSITELFPIKDESSKVYVQKLDDAIFMIIDSLRNEDENN